MTTPVSIEIRRGDRHAEEHATLVGIATFAGCALQDAGHLDRHSLLDVLATVEQAARGALGRPLDPEDPPGTGGPPVLSLPPAGRTTPGEERRWSATITPQRCAAVLLADDPPPHLARMPLVDILSRVDGLGPHGARRLLLEHRLAQHQHVWVSALPPRVSALLAARLRDQPRVTR